MTDTPNDAVQLPPAPFRLIAQYLKDLSFENPGAVQVLTIPQREVPRGQPLFVHGWVYALSDGLVKDLEVTVSGPQERERLTAF